RQRPRNPRKFSSLRTRKTERKYVMPNLTPTLTQSRLLDVLLQHRLRKVIQLAGRRAHRKYLRAAFWSTLAAPMPNVLPFCLYPVDGERSTSDVYWFPYLTNLPSATPANLVKFR